MKKKNYIFYKTNGLKNQSSANKDYSFYSALTYAFQNIDQFNNMLFQNKGKSPPGRALCPGTDLSCSGTSNTSTFTTLAKNKTFFFN